MLFEILLGQSPSFNHVDKVVPDIGKQDKASPVLPNQGRLIKTHEPYRTEYKKAIYLVRDARDVALSEFAYQKALGLAGDDFDMFLQRFLRGTVNPFGSWTAHVDSWVKAKDDARAQILVVRFDEMRRYVRKPEQPESRSTCLRQADETIDPPCGELVGALRVVEPRRNGLEAELDLARGYDIGRTGPIEPVGRRAGHRAVDSDAVENDVEQQRESGLAGRS